MAITATARRSPGARLPKHESTLQATVPEAVEVFDHRAFDELLGDMPTDTRNRLLVPLAACVARQAVREYRVVLGVALHVGVTAVEAKELAYQALPKVGTGRLFDFLHATSDALHERGVALPLPPQAATSAATWVETVRAVLGRALGGEECELLGRKC